MIQIINIETMGWEAAIRSMRNPMNSWNKMDSGTGCSHRNTWKGEEDGVHLCQKCGAIYDSRCACTGTDKGFKLGPNDLDLACRLIKAGTEHAKFLRMIHVQMDITAPLYYWKEMDQYKVATATNSCSTMHRITAKPFVIDDFSHEHLDDFSISRLNNTIEYLNSMREMFLLDKNKHFWWQMIQLLPSSYNQLRTWDGSMQTVLSILKQRKGHKLDEWEQFRQACFENIPYCKEFYEAYTGKDE